MNKNNDVEKFVNKIILGNCINIMKEIPSNSIDCVVTDPPYGIGFMGKKWDKALPPKEAFTEMYRVLKAGGLAFVMSSPRQDVLWRMMQMLEDVGFELKQSFISWIYKTGFPKAYDLSLGIDKKFIREEFLAEHGRKPTKEEMKKLVKDKRKVVGKGKGTSWNFQNKINVEQEFRPSDYYEDKSGDFFITKAYTKEAKKWEGWKSQTGLKPAHETILMVNKPMSEKTIVDNVLVHGVGAVNVDACRIPFKSEEDEEQHKKNDMGSRPNQGQNYGRMGRGYDSGHGAPLPSFQPKGRFPANLLVSDGALDTGKISKSGTIEPHHKINHKKTNEIYGKYTNLPASQQTTYGDSGNQSRYFDLDAWAKHHGFLDVAKASKAERNMGLETSNISPKIANPNYGKGGFKRPTGQPERTIAKVKNFHPTVKPVKLMAYLIELGCPLDGVVLDPFVGSGTTCIAAKRLKRKWIGIELNPEYRKIACARIGCEITPFEGVFENIKESLEKQSIITKAIKIEENSCIKPDIGCGWRSFDGKLCLRKKGCNK